MIQLLPFKQFSLLSLFVLLFSFGAYSQNMQINTLGQTGQTAEEMLKQVFLGEGVEVLNVTYNGDTGAVGAFKGGLNIIGIEEGMVMTTGKSWIIPGQNTATNDGANNGITNVNDQDLAAISSNNMRDECIYVIDFIPKADTLRFKYVFASDEYKDYVCSINDVFGFFLSGPGINGTFSNMSTNIALVPNTTIPVGVNSINHGSGGSPGPTCFYTNTQYFVDNNGPNPSTVTNAPYNIKYDGFTTVLTATAVVTPCVPHKIKLAIGDAVDNIFDSGVFLAASSFGTRVVETAVLSPSFDNTVAESCDSAVVDFGLSFPTESPYSFNLIFGGNAVMGVDYDSIPTTLTIPAGGDSTGIIIRPIEDNIAEGTDTIQLIVLSTSCESDTFTILITDNTLPPPVVNDTILCRGDTIQLDATVPVVEKPSQTFMNDIDHIPIPDGQSFPVFMKGDTVSPATVAGVSMFNYRSGAIDSVCINIDHVWLSDVDVYLFSPDGDSMELSTDNGTSVTLDGYKYTCFSPTAINNIDDPAFASPFSGQWLPEGSWNDLNGAAINGVWNLKVFDDSFGFDGTIDSFKIVFTSVYNASYQWAPADGLSCTDCPNPLAFPDTTTTYIVEVFDSYGCSTFDTVTVDVIEPLPAPVANCDSTCTDFVAISWPNVPGATSYEINVDSTSWIALAPGDTSYMVTGLAANQTVQFEIRAVGGLCGNNLIDTLYCSTAPCNNVLSLDSLSDVSCFGGATGFIHVNATSCTPPITYNINGGAAQNNGLFDNLIAGTYQVIATDINSCSDTLNFNISEPTQLTKMQTVTDVSCNGQNDGTATTTIMGGTPNYTYAWNTTPPQDSSTATNLTAGTYIVTITDANNCQILDTLVVNEPTPLTLSMSSTTVNCNGNSTGTATATVSGGTQNYTYAWNTSPAQFTQTATNLPTGTYTVTVTDANLCTIVDSVFVNEEPAIVLSTSAIPAGCSGASQGSVSVTASGGVGGFTYAWNTTPIQNTATVTGLPAGTYIVTVTDTNMCSDTAWATVTQALPLTSTVTGNPATCIGVNDGDATVIASGGDGNYTYLWDNTQTGTTATGLGEGNHSVVVTDGNGCTDTSTIYIGTLITLTSTTSGMDASCFGGSDGTATVTLSNGTAPYNYAWSTTPTQNTMTATNLSAGNYYVMVTDASGCTAVDSVVIGQPVANQTNVAFTAVSCNNGNDGTATVVPQGGTAPYTFVWSTNPSQTSPTAVNLQAQSYYVTVTDANGCAVIDSVQIIEPTPITTTFNITNIDCFGESTGAATATSSGGAGGYQYAWNTNPVTTGATISSVPAGSYTVTITDASNCIQTEIITISQPPTGMMGTVSVTDVSCNGGSDGSATAIVTGGTSPYTYLWSNNNTSATASNLRAGSYTVTATDVGGCTFTSTVTIDEPAAITALLVPTASSCNGGNDGSAYVTASGGTPNANGSYSYTWNTVPIQFSDTAVGLVGGQTYLVVITDGNGCSITESVTIGQPSSISLQTTHSNVNCFGDTDGSVSVTAAGGTPGYQYLWSPNANSDTNAIVNNLPTGTFTVTVTDAVGCTQTAQANVTQPSPLQTTVSATDVVCKGEATGTTTVLAAGGSPFYNFQWDTATGNQNGKTAINLPTGWYHVTVTDNNGCEKVDSTFVDEPTIGFTADFTSKDITCFGGRDGEILINASGGFVPYEFSFNGINYDQASRRIGLFADEYIIYARDGAGCILTDTLVITEPDQMTIDLGPDTLITLGSDVTLSPTIVNGTPPFSYIWRPTDSLDCSNCAEVIAKGLQTDTYYQVFVSDANGCEQEDDLIIRISKPRVVYIATGFSPNNDGINDALFVQGNDQITNVREFMVYDRWGELIFRSENTPVNDPTTGWDGTFKGEPMNSAVFSYSVTVEFIDGEVITYKGNTTLVR